MRFALSIALTFTLAASGCDAFADDPANRSFAESVLAVRGRMHARFVASRRAEQAIALGDLETARAEARTISELAIEPDVLPAWQRYLDNVRRAAAQVDASKDLAVAGRMTALLGSQCAKCHVATAAKIVFAKDPAPKDDPRLAARMASHQWAASRMWDGIVAPSEERWLEGARLLAKAPVTITAESDRLGIADDVARIRLYATRALTAKPGERAPLYGEILATCAHCHYAIRDIGTRRQ